MEPRTQGSMYNRAGVATQAQIDAGLRQYMLKVYNYMTVGMLVTALVALAVTQIPALSQIFYQTVQVGGRTVTQMTILGWIALFAPLVMVFFLSARIHAMSASAAQTTFWVYAGMVGLSLSPILAVYTGMSVAKVFFMTAGMFGAMSLYGYTTKRDLSKLGSFLIMGLIGIIIAMLVNLFLQSPALHFAISVIGVLIFVGLTAYDTQKIKEMYNRVDDSEVMGKKAIMGALMLYLDFLNMFIFLLMLFGNRE